MPGLSQSLRLSKSLSLPAAIGSPTQGGGGQPVPSWVLPGAVQDTDWAGARYHGGEPGTDILISRASPSIVRNAAGILMPVAANDFARSDLGLQTEWPITAKNTNFNANPVDLANVSKKGDAAATLTVVDDMPALTEAGLHLICTSGKVYKLDNSLGTGIASIEFVGLTATTANHIALAHVRGTGTVGIFVAGTGGLSAPNVALTSGYQQIKSAVASNSAARVSMVTAAAGTVVYVILNQLVQTTLISSPVVTAGAAATRAADNVTQAKTIPSTFSVVVEGVSGPTPISSLGQVLLEVSDGGNNKIQIARNNTPNLRVVVFVGGVATVAQSVAGLADNTRFKLGVAHDGAGNYAVSLNGAAVIAYTGLALPALTQILFGQSVGGEQWLGFMRRFTLWNSKISDADLMAFTNLVTPEAMFSSNSLWNSYPVNPTLASTPVTTFASMGVEANAFAPAVFTGYASDAPATIYGPNNDNGPRVSDEKRNRVVVVPHFPAGVTPPSGSDGHVEIIDMPSRQIHAFYQLRYVAERTRWEAATYSIYALDGDGQGMPSKPSAPRASGMPAIAGALRKHEVGRSIVDHALAAVPNAGHMKTGPVSPATIEDYNGGVVYTGTVRMGDLLMLPASFDVNLLANDETKAIARTLKKYGARVVDTTDSPFFTFAAELGAAGWNRPDKAGWYDDLALIRDAMRIVTGQSGWIGGANQAVVPSSNDRKNLISMRGTWTKTAGAGIASGSFDTIKDGYIWADGQGDVTMSALRYPTWTEPQGTGQAQQPWWRWLFGDYWYMNPEVGQTYTVTVEGSEPGVSASFAFVDTGYTTIVTSGYLTPGQSAQIVVPAEFGTGAAFGRQFVRRVGSVGEARVNITMTKVAA